MLLLNTLLLHFDLIHWILLYLSCISNETEETEYALRRHRLGSYLSHTLSDRL